MAASGTLRRGIAPQVYGPYEDTRLSEGLWLASKLPEKTKKILGQVLYHIFFSLFFSCHISMNLWI